MRALLQSAALVVAGLAGATACDEPGSSLVVTGTRASRAPDARVVVEVDLLAYQRLGGNLGTYCTRVTFVGQDAPAEVCSADLEDGDTKTVRLASERWVPPGSAIAIRVRLAAVDIGRSLAAPP